MAIPIKKEAKRGFVMTGGGAKGYYEAGVIHAFHLCDMEFDVITGSSIGAINAVVYAEYLLRKRTARGTPEEIQQEMDNFIGAFLYAWFNMERLNIIDDSEDGPIGRLKDDLLKFAVDLPIVTDIVWWWTTPNRWQHAWPLGKLTRAAKELFERVGPGGFVEIARQLVGGKPIRDAILETYLGKYGLRKALVPPGSAAENRLRDAFTKSNPVLRSKHLEEEYAPDEAEAGGEVVLMDPERTFGDYKRGNVNVDVRLTRANYRTGRLEISAYTTDKDFVAFLDKHDWRFMTAPREGLPLGSYRVQVPGNPTAIDAALASGRFPGVFAPFPITDMYDLERADNGLLKHILSNWLEDPEAQDLMFEAYRALHGDEPDIEQKWERELGKWKDSAGMRDFFPRMDDTYVDGGAIDNTPSNSAVDAIREWIDREQESKRDFNLDLYTIFLHPEPRVDPDEIEDPALHQVVQRTLEIQGAAKLSSDAVVVETINRYGRTGEYLAETLGIVLEAASELDDANKMALLDKVFEKAAEYDGQKYKDPRRRTSHFKALMDENAQDRLERLTKWNERLLTRGLPLNVEVVKIHPDEMPMSTLQFTKRFGYKKDNAIGMITMGCYNALWSLRNHLESKHPDDLDEHDERALGLVRQLMDIDDWPSSHDDLEALREDWKCTRTGCIFYQDHCRRGASSPKERESDELMQIL
jgi:hypothetical protein